MVDGEKAVGRTLKILSHCWIVFGNQVIMEPSLDVKQIYDDKYSNCHYCYTVHDVLTFLRHINVDVDERRTERQLIKQQKGLAQHLKECDVIVSLDGFTKHAYYTKISNYVSQEWKNVLSPVDNRKWSIFFFSSRLSRNFKWFVKTYFIFCTPILTKLMF